MTARAETALPLSGRRLVVFTAVLGAAMSLLPLSIDGVLPAFPAMAAGLAVEPAAIQATLGALLVGSGIGQLLFGPLSDRFGRRPVLLFGLGLYIAAAAGCAAAGSVEAMAALRLLQGLATAAIQIIVRAIVRDRFEREAGARALGYVMAVNGAAPVFSPMIGALVASRFGWRAVFVMLAGFALLVSVLVARMVVESLPPGHRRSVRLGAVAATMRLIFAEPTFRVFVAVNVAAFTGLYIYLANAPAVLMTYMGMSVERFGIYFGATMVGFVAAQIACSRLVGRVSMIRLMGVGAVLSATGSVAMAALAFAGVAEPAAIFVPMFLICASLAFIVPQGIALALAPFPHAAGTASSLFGFCQLTCTALIGTAVGLLDHGTQHHMTTAIGLGGIVVLALYLALVRPRERALPSR